MQTKSSIKVIFLCLAISVFFMGTVFGTGLVRAADAGAAASATISPCTIEGDMSRTLTTWVGTNSQRTNLNDKYESGFLNAYIMITGAHLEETMGCQQALMDKTKINFDTGFPACNATPADTCDDIANTMEAPSNPKNSTPSQPTQLPYNNQPHRSGSLIHFAYKIENNMRDTPPYANLAYFVGRTAEKIPLVNKAFAQSVDYQHYLIKLIYDVWIVMCNLALAIMSIILLVIGIMIILRKKVNQQVIVSVQYALPKIVLAFILIVMSYPIGATITSVAWTLNNSARTIVSSLFSSFIAGNLQEIGPGALIQLITIAIVASIATAGLVIPGILGIVALVAFICGLAFVWVEIKMFLLYLKMLVSIISAPIEFVIGAVPGSDDKVAAWFRRMAVYAVSLFAMRAVFYIGVHIALVVVTSAAKEGLAGGFLIASLVPVMILLYSISLAIGIEPKIQGFIDPASLKKK